LGRRETGKGNSAVRVGLARDDLTGELVFNRYLARGDDPDAVQGLLAAAAPKWCGSLRVWKGPRDQIPIDVSDRGAGRHRAGSCRRAGRDLLRDGGAVRPPRPRGTKPRSRVEREPGGSGYRRRCGRGVCGCRPSLGRRTGIRRITPRWGSGCATTSARSCSSPRRNADRVGVVPDWET
jgi:hypothetical protein